MRGIEHSVRAMTGVVALLLFAPVAEAAVEQKPAKQTLRRPAIDKPPHNLVLQVNVNDLAMMNLALNNATNVAQYYKDLGEKVTIEVVTFGPGLHMLRDDTSPVKARIKSIREGNPAISFKACGNTQEKHAQGQEQGHSPHPRGDSREVRRRACHGAAGKWLGLCKALMRRGRMRAIAFSWRSPWSPRIRLISYPEAPRACANPKGDARDWASRQLALRWNWVVDELSGANSRPSLQRSEDPSIGAGIRGLLSLELDRQQEPADHRGDDP